MEIVLKIGMAVFALFLIVVFYFVVNNDRWRF